MRYLFLLFFLCALLIGCNDDVIFDSSEIVSSSTFMSIDAGIIGTSRGSVVFDESDMATVGMYCAYTGQNNWSSSTVFNNRYNNAKFTYSAGEWSTANPVRWNFTSMTDKYTFFAYSPYSNNGEHGITTRINNGEFEIQYEVPDTCKDQKDLLVAVPRKDIYPQIGTRGKAHMIFNHALTKVSFSVKGDSLLTIKKIVIKDVCKKATYAYDNSSSKYIWTTDATKIDYEVNAGTGIDDELYLVKPNDSVVNITKDSTYLFMIPQDVGEKKIFVTLSNNREKKLTIPAGSVWKAGEAINYIINTNPVRIEVEVGRVVDDYWANNGTGYPEGDIWVLTDITKIDDTENWWEFNEVVKRADSAGIEVKLVFPNLVSFEAVGHFNASVISSISAPIVGELPNGFFENCPKLKEIDFPLVTKLGERVFINNSSLKTVNLPMIDTIGSAAFQECSSLETISFLNVTTIYDNAFSKCDSLKTVKLPKVTTISTGTFQDCDMLESMELATDDDVKLISLGGILDYDNANIDLTIGRTNDEYETTKWVPSNPNQIAIKVNSGESNAFKTITYVENEVTP